MSQNASTLSQAEITPALYNYKNCNCNIFLNTNNEVGKGKGLAPKKIAENDHN